MRNEELVGGWAEEVNIRGEKANTGLTQLGIRNEELGIGNEEKQRRGMLVGKDIISNLKTEK
jgi:hypothetical protein